MPLTRRQVYRRRRIVVFGGLGAVLGIALYVPLTLTAPLDAVAARVAPPAVPAAAPAELVWPAATAGAIAEAAVDAGDGDLLGTAGSLDPLPMASITKIVTALVVLDAHPLAPGEEGPDIAFGPDDVGFYEKYLARNGKVVWVSSGMVLSQRDVLTVTLLESANNYAETLATWAFGSESAYVDAARAWLAESGFGTITVVDSNGLSPQNRGSAPELVRLGRLALAHPVVAELVATPAAEVAGLGAVENTNLLLGTDGVDGIKTGTLDEAGACLLFAADREVAGRTLTFVGVALGAESHGELREQVRALLASAQAGFTEISLAVAGQEVGEYVSEWGETAPLVVAEDGRAVVWSDTAPGVDLSARAVAVGADGADVGVLRFRIGDETLEVPVELGAALTDPGPWWRLTHPLELLF